MFSLPAFCHSNHNQFSCCGSRQAGGLDLLLSNPQGQLSHAPATRASFTVLPRLGAGVGVGMGAALPSADRASSLTHALRASSLKLPRQGVGLLSGMPEYQCPGEVGHRDGTHRPLLPLHSLGARHGQDLTMAPGRSAGYSHQDGCHHPLLSPVPPLQRAHTVPFSSSPTSTPHTSLSQWHLWVSAARPPHSLASELTRACSPHSSLHRHSERSTRSHSHLLSDRAKPAV